MENWIGNLIEQMGYLGIVFLMFIENVFPPIPSEIIMPLAGYTAAQGELTLLGVIVAGSFGSLLGALMWYGVGRKLGADRLADWASRHGRWITLSPDDVSMANRWFSKHGYWAVLFGRLIPTLRTLIAVPAGIFKMPPLIFLFLTSIGTVMWEGSLAYLGYKMGENYEVVDRYIGPVSAVVLVVLLCWYVYRVVTFDKKIKK